MSVYHVLPCCISVGNLA